MATFLIALVPSIGALFGLWLALRAVIQADRRERTAMARIEAERDRSARGAASAPGAPGALARGEAPTSVQQGPGTGAERGEDA